MSDPNLSQEKRATALAGNIHDHHRWSTKIRARMLDAVGEFDEEGCAERLGAKHAASWLARGVAGG